MAHRFLALGMTFLAAMCDSTPETPESPESNQSSETRATTRRTCTVPGLENATRIEPLTLPSGCRFAVTGGPPTAPFVVRDAEGFAAALTCDGATPPAIDLATSDLYLVSYTMSPASTGMEPRDDGTTVTLVTRFRQPCDGDPLPMPMNGTLAFTMPKNSTRSFREANCTLPLDCD